MSRSSKPFAPGVRLRCLRWPFRKSRIMKAGAVITLTERGLGGTEQYWHVQVVKCGTPYAVSEDVLRKHFEEVKS